MSTQPTPFITPEEYLEIERKAESKSEYYKGEVFAMAGASRAHNRIVGNLIGQFYQQLRNSTCEAYPSDMRVQVSDAYLYPDVSVVCGESRLADGQFDNLINPTLIVEVLSPSTEAYDRIVKFELYQGIESLQQYLMVSADRLEMDLCTRQSDGTWLLSKLTQWHDAADLRSIGCRLAAADVYENVQFPARPVRYIRPVQP
jgi:Uma2 family endonuclease